MIWVGTSGYQYPEWKGSFYPATLSNYLYSFIPHSHGQSIVALSVEDNEMAEQVLKQHQFSVLKQADISR